MLDLVFSNIHDLGDDFQISRTILVEEFKLLALAEKNIIIQTERGNHDVRLALLEVKNDSTFLIQLFALWELGCAVILINESLTEFERNNIIDFYRPNLLMQDGIWKVKFENSSQELNGVALILLTSGTTGKPKGVKLSFQALRNKIDILKNEFHQSEMPNALNFLPMSFGHGLIANTLLPLFYSQNLFIAKKLDFKMIANINSIIGNLQIHFFSSVPFFWKLLIQNELSLKSNTSLKRVHSASADLPNDLVKQIVNLLPGSCEFYNAFGLTEMAAWVAFSKYSEENGANSFIFFDSVKTKLIDGELCLKAPFMFDGYYSWNNSDLDDEGFFMTGDLFEGNSFLGRKKEIVNKGGVKIFLSEIDQLVHSSGMVEDVLSFKYFLNTEEMLGVGVVLKSKIEIQMLEEFVKQNISPQKWPNRFYSVNKIDRNSRGKVSRDEFSKKFK